MVTVTSCVPVPAGEVAISDVVEVTLTAVAEVAPNLTEVPVANPVPVTVTWVPPEAGPVLGDTPDTVGGFGVADW